MILLIPSAFWLLTAIFYLAIFKWENRPFRHSVLAASLTIFFFIAASTELLSAFRLITHFAASCCWIALNLVLLALFLTLCRRHQQDWKQLVTNWLEHGRQFVKNLGGAASLVLISVLGIALTVALIATPNNPDSLSYHISRIGYWIQNGHVGHYASHIERAISFPPFSEYVHLHTYLLAGSDRYFQLLQWSCLVLILVTLSLLTEQLSTSRTALQIALTFAVTLPIVVLESMTTQNDLVVSFFILAEVWAIFSFTKTKNPHDLLFLVPAAALGLLTKGTFAFYAAPFCFYLLVFMLRQSYLRPMLAVVLAVGLTCTFLLNFPFWHRTHAIFGTPIGTLTNGNQNDFTSPARLASSFLKHTFLHLGFVSPQNRYNLFLEGVLQYLHSLLGVRLDDPGTGMPFKMNKLNFNEDFAHNFEGIWLIILSLPLTYFQHVPARVRTYVSLTVVSFFIFCFFISYQTYGSRLHIPFFLLMAPALGALFAQILYPFTVRLLVLITWLTALPFALLSVSHPLLSTRWFFDQIADPINSTLHLQIRTSRLANLKQESILHIPPEKMIWGDQWDEVGRLKNCVDSLGASSVGFSFEEYSYDYGYQCILQMPGRSFAHVLVRNPSKILEKKEFIPDCIVAEHNEGSSVFYHGQWYAKIWSGTNRWVYAPAKRL